MQETLFGKPVLASFKFKFNGIKIPVAIVREGEWANIHVFHPDYDNGESNSLFCQDPAEEWQKMDAIDRETLAFCRATSHYLWSYFYHAYKAATGDDEAVVNPGVWRTGEKNIPASNANPYVAALETIGELIADASRPENLLDKHFVVRIE